MIIVCPHCKKKAHKDTGDVNRAKKLGVPIYCSRKCSGLARRINRTEAEKKRIKAEYDDHYRRRDYVKKQRHEYFLKDYAKNPEKYKSWRQKRKQKHAEYCRRPEYRKWKQKYDEKYHAKKAHGEFWECFLLIKEIKKEYDQREVRQINNLHNKSQKRKRRWQQLAKRNYLQVT